MKKHFGKACAFLGVILLSVVFVSFFYLFYMQTIYPPETGIFLSDLQAHVRGALAGRGYSLNRIVLKYMYAVLGNTVGVAIFLSAIMVFTILAVYYFFICIDSIKGKNRTDKMRLSYLGLAFSSIFLISIYLPNIYEYFYKYTLNANAYHNSTFIEMRLFAILSVCWYMKIQKDYLLRIKIVDWIIFTIFLSITNAFKPSFIIGFAPVMLLFFIKDFCLNFKDLRRVRNIITFGSAVLFSLVPLIYQYKVLFGSDSNGGVAFKLGGTFFNGGSPFWQLICGISLPVIIFVYNFVHKNVDRMYSVIWFNFVVNFIIKATLVETGSRANDGNFGWGCRCAIFFLFIYSLYILLHNITDIIREKKWSKGNCVYVIVTSCMFAAHLVSGMVYFWGNVFCGNSYLI